MKAFFSTAKAFMIDSDIKSSTNPAKLYYGMEQSPQMYLTKGIGLHAN
jgi:hypothetical protein